MLIVALLAGWRLRFYQRRARAHGRLRAANLRKRGLHDAPADHPVRAHHDDMSFHEHVAVFITDRVGTMTFCYSIAVWMLAWIVVQAVAGVYHASFDAYPYPFLFFCLGGVMQSLLMPMIMVAQNIVSKMQERHATASYTALKHLQEQMDHLELLLKQSLKVNAPPPPPPPAAPPRARATKRA